MKYCVYISANTKFTWNKHNIWCPKCQAFQWTKQYFLNWLVQLASWQIYSSTRTHDGRCSSGSNVLTSAMRCQNQFPRFEASTIIASIITSTHGKKQFNKFLQTETISISKNTLLNINVNEQPSRLHDSVERYVIYQYYLLQLSLPVKHIYYGY